MPKTHHAIHMVSLGLVVLAGVLGFCNIHNTRAAGTITLMVQPTKLADGSYGGTVTSDVGGINCAGTAGTCSANLPYGSTVTLTATSTDPATSFDTWYPGFSGICSGGVDTNSTCALTLPNDGSVYATGVTWKQKHDFNATVTTDGGMSGPSITVNPGSKTCAGQCDYYYAYGTSMSVATATTNPDTVFTGWVGSSGISNCGTNPTCSFSGDPAIDGFYAIANWDWKTYNANVVVRGSGSGKVTSEPGNLACSANCSASFARNTSVGFSATPSNGSKFSGWGTMQEGGTICLESLGKGFSSTRKTNTTCQVLFGSTPSERNSTLVAYFDKSDTSGASSTAPATSSSTTPVSHSGTPASIAAVNQQNSSNATTVGVSQLKLNTYNPYSHSSILQFAAGAPITLSGTTVPHAIVKLFIFSTPRQATVVADAQGHWSYRISGLASGSHHVEAQVVDPVKGTTSPRLTVVNFAVTSSPKANSVHSDNLHAIWLYGIGVAVIILLAGGGYVGWFYRRHKRLPPLNPVRVWQRLVS